MTDSTSVDRVTTSEYLDMTRRLSEVLTPGDLDTTLAQITAAAVEVLPEVRHASITIRHADCSLETVAPTDDLVLDLDAAQYEWREGPCYEAATESVHVTSPCLEQDERWPRYSSFAVRAGVRAQAAVRLFDAAGSSGALNLYADHDGAFEDLGILGELFTHQAAVAIEYAREITQLREAVQTRQLIGQAVGVVMRQYGLGDAQAFAFLARMSTTHNTKLKVVAERIVSEVGSKDALAP